MADELELDVIADECSELGDQLLGAEAGQRAPVQLDLDLARDDVDLRAAANNGCVDGVAEHRLERRAALPEQAQSGVREARLQERPQHEGLLARQLLSEALDEFSDDGRHVHGQALPVEVGEQPAEPATVPPRLTMAPWPPGPRTVAFNQQICFSATWIG